MQNPKMKNYEYIKIYQLNEYFDHVAEMLVEHFNKKEYDKTLFVLGMQVIMPISQIKDQNAGYKVIVYQSEQLMSGDNWHNVQMMIKHFKDADEIWDYDPINIAYLKQHNVRVNRHLPMLSTESLKRIDNKPNPYFDVLFYGYMNERRHKIIHQIQKELYNRIKLKWVFGTHDLDLDIADSKTILNLHAFEPYNRQEQVRMFYPVINGKTVISEKSQVNNMEGCIIETEIKDLSNLILSVINSNIWYDFGKNATSNFESKSRAIIDNFVDLP